MLILHRFCIDLDTLWKRIWIQKYYFWLIPFDSSDFNIRELANCYSVRERSPDLSSLTITTAWRCRYLN